MGSGQVLRHKRGVQELHCGIGKVRRKEEGGGSVLRRTRGVKLVARAQKRCPPRLCGQAPFYNKGFRNLKLITS